MNPLLMEIPDELRGPRLLLRTPRPGDGRIVYPSVRESLVELKQWMPWAKDDYNEQAAEEWCRKAAAQFLSRQQLQYLIIAAADGAHLGTIGAFKFDWDVRSGEIGYWLRTIYTGRGFMNEAVGMICQMLRANLNFRRIQICADTNNHRSRRVAQRGGFELEGVHRKDSLTTDGGPRDTCVFAWVSDVELPT
jgi:RimJ/RimL family protein N-acetyltransferase